MRFTRDGHRGVTIAAVQLVATRSAAMRSVAVLEIVSIEFMNVVGSHEPSLAVSVSDRARRHRRAWSVTDEGVIRMVHTRVRAVRRRLARACWTLRGEAARPFGVFGLSIFDVCRPLP